MLLQRHDRAVLRPQILRILRCRDPDRALALGGAQRQAALADRREMRAARHQRHLDPGPGQPDREIAADRAGTVDADPPRAPALAPRPSFPARPIRCSFPVAPFGLPSSSSTVRGTLKSANSLPTTPLIPARSRNGPQREE